MSGVNNGGGTLGSRFLEADGSRRFKRVEGAKAMIWKLTDVQEKNWNKLNAPELLGEVYAGKKIVDGLPVPESLTKKERVAA